MYIARARCECQTAVGSSGLNAHWRAVEFKFFSLIPDSSVGLSAGIHSVCWRFGVWDPDGFESCIQQRKTTCLLSIRISLACARASKLTTTNMYVCMYICMHACMYVCMHACMYVCTSNIYIYMYNIYIYGSTKYPAISTNHEANNTWPLNFASNIICSVLFDHPRPLDAGMNRAYRFTYRLVNHRNCVSQNTAADYYLTIAYWYRQCHELLHCLGIVVLWKLILYTICTHH